MAQGKLNLTCLMTDIASGEQSVVNLKVLSSASPPDRPQPGPTPPGTEPPQIWDPLFPFNPIAEPPWGWGNPEPPGTTPPGGGQPPQLRPPSEGQPGLAAVRNAPADATPPADTSNWTFSQVAYGPGKVANALIGPYIEHHPV